MSNLDEALKPLTSLPYMDSDTYQQIAKNVSVLIREEKSRSYSTIYRVLKERDKDPADILDTAKTIVWNALKAHQPEKEDL